MIYYIQQKHGHCLDRECYFCPIERCTRYTMGVIRVVANSEIALKLVKDKAERKAVKIMKEIKECK